MTIARQVRCAVLAAVLLAAARPVSAQAFIEVPLAWLTPSPAAGEKAQHARGFGFSWGKLAQIHGLETQFVYFPKFVFSGADVKSSHAFFFSASELFGPWIHERYKVYGGVGFGELHHKLVTLPTSEAAIESITSDLITIDIGPGAFVLISKRLGCRVDVRRGWAFRLSDEPDAEKGPFGIKFKHTNYWRVSVGFIATFGKKPPPRR